jgi:hypothetical protein
MPNNPPPRLSGDEIEVRIWAFVVVTVTLILGFIVVSILYSVTFVTQPIKAMAPIDQAYTKMLNDIVLLIVGGIGGVMTKRAARAVANAIAPEPPKPPAPTVSGPAPIAPTGPLPDFNWMGFTNPQLDETWVPPPPPTTAPDYIPPEASEIAQERAEARGTT